MIKTSCLICVVFAIHCSAPASGNSIFLLLTSKRAPVKAASQESLLDRRSSRSKTSGEPYSRPTSSESHSRPTSHSKPKTGDVAGKAVKTRKRSKESSSNSKQNALIQKGEASDFENNSKTAVTDDAAEITFYIPTSTVLVHMTGQSKQRLGVTGIRVREVEEDSNRFLEVDLTAQKQSVQLRSATQNFLFREKIPKDFDFGHLTGKDGDTTTLHIASDAVTAIDRNITFDEFCVADITFDPMVYGLSLPTQIYPYVDKDDFRLKVFMQTMPDAPLVVISEEIPAYCVVEDEFPALSVVFQRGSYAVKVKVGDRKNFGVIRNVKQIQFDYSADRDCVANIDLSDSSRLTGDKLSDYHLVERDEQLLDGTRRFEVLLKFNSGFWVILTQQIPRQCAMYYRYAGPRERGAAVSHTVNFGTSSPKLDPDRFTNDIIEIPIVMDKSCWATVNLAGYACQELKNVKTVEMVWTQKTLLIIENYCNSKVLGAEIPNFLECAISFGEILVKNTSKGYYKMKLGEPKATVIVKA